MKVAMFHILAGDLSHTPGPPTFWYKRDGSVKLFDGRHRVCKKIREGCTTIEMGLISEIPYEDYLILHNITRPEC